MLGTVGMPTMAGIAGLLFSMWAKGATTGTAVAGGAVSGGGAGILTSLLESVLGMGGMSVGAAGMETARRGSVAWWAPRSAACSVSAGRLHRGASTRRLGRLSS
jgi:hypothetical protein